MNHYYNKEVSVASNPKQINHDCFNQSFKFITDQGVFSRGGIDYGTQVLLKALVEENIKGPVLDVGCGYGVIGIVLNRVLNLEVDMVDVNKRALELAIKNKALNHVDAGCVFESDGLSQVEEMYQTIVTNPPIRAGKEVVHRILKDAYQHVNQSGCLYVVIQKKQGAPSALKLLESIFDDVSIIERDGGYYVIKAKRVYKDI